MSYVTLLLGEMILRERITANQSIIGGVVGVTEAHLATAPGPTGVFSSFTGTHRFEVSEQLGTGSMCVVYRAVDTVHGDVVALKTLRHLDSNSLYRLKREFRALSTFDHPNLVSFYELVYSDQGWFVTMELVEGVDFLTWTRGADANRMRSETPSYGTWNTVTHTDLRFAQSAPAGKAATKDSSTTAFCPLPDGKLPDLMRLRSALRQLCEGVQAIHAAGRLHRDLKPSNVLVTDAGRVVILDFGLVAEIDQDYTEGTLHQNIAGSAAYMSPEQSTGIPLTPASDWYAVGVMLYESLTGIWPYSGHLYQILTAKQEEDPAAPIDLVPDVPEDLNELCMSLLSRDPRKRPSAEQILEIVRSRAVAVVATQPRVQPRFRFRSPQLRALINAFQTAKWGQAVTCLVRGSSGMGKTTLVREYIKGVKRRETVITLKGRCYEWETVPYKALDGVVDNLSRVLRRMDHRAVATLTNDGVSYLAQLFPVLNRVDALGILTPADLNRISPEELAKRAFRSLIQLIRVLCQYQVVLLYIDDVQWADAASARVLAEIIRANTDQPLVLVLGYRPGERGPFLQTMLPMIQRTGTEIRSIDLEPLDEEQSAVIAAEMLGTEVTDERVQQVVMQASGIPQYLKELVRQLEFQGYREVSSEPLTEVVINEVMGLPTTSRRLLVTLALATEPISTEVAIGAATLGKDAFQAITTLRAHHLINMVSNERFETLELASERLREFIADDLDEQDRQRAHQQLAVNLERTGEATAEALVTHFLGAGQPERAGVIAWMAARRAVEIRRFHDAIWLLEQAGDHGVWNPRERRTILAMKADSLVAVGSSRLAAIAYLEAAKDAPHSRAFTLQQQAAAQLLFCGSTSDGTALVNRLLREVGLSLSTGFLQRQFQRLRRMRIHWRGLDFHKTPAATVPMEQLQRIDLCWAGSMGLSLVDHQAAERYQGHLMESALETGESARVVRAMALEIHGTAVRQPDGGGWKELYDLTIERAKMSSEGEGVGWALLSACSASYAMGAWQQVETFARQSKQVFEKQEVGNGWAHFLADDLALRSVLRRGELRRAAKVAQATLREVERSKNSLFIINIVAGSIIWLRMAEDAPDTALHELRAVEQLLHESYAIQRMVTATARAQLELYRGKYTAAFEVLDDRWKTLEALAERVDPTTRVEFYLARARTAIALARVSSSPDRMRKLAVQAVNAAKKQRRAWATPWIQLLEMNLQLLRSAVPADEVKPVIQAFENTGQQSGVAIAQWFYAHLAEGEESMGALQVYHQWVRRQGIRDPHKFANGLQPIDLEA